MINLEIFEKLPQANYLRYFLEKSVKLSVGSFLEFDAIIKFYETKFLLTQTD